MAVNSRNILFVINPNSGTNDKTGLINYIDDFTARTGFQKRIFYVTGTDAAVNLKKEINDFKPEIVVAVGGDGTCNLVAGAILHTETSMAIIPLGSANGLATELGIPKSFENALDLLISGKTRLIDTIIINDKLCLHISDIGFNARVIKRFEKEKIRGIYGYTRQFFKELWDTQPFRIRIVLGNGRVIQKRAYLVALANASKYGTGAMINPNGKIDDGKFELVIVKPYSLMGFFSVMAAIFMGYLDKIRHAEISSHKKIKIIKNKSQPLHIDGEILEESDEIEAEINPSSLKVIIP